MYEVYSMYRNLDGQSIEKTPITHPYSYDEHVIWIGDYEKGNSIPLHSDRLMNQDYDKFRECCKNIFGDTGQYFHNRKAKDIELFLSVFLDKDIQLTAITETCNISNGYPYWTFYIKK